MSESTEEKDFVISSDQVYQKSKESLTVFKNKIVAFSKNPEHSFEIISDFSQLVDSVNELVNHKNIDLVIMGARRETEDKDITFGSNTLQVIKYVNCPVLAVPSVYGEATPQNLLFPTDYMLPYKTRELALVSGIAKYFNTQIHLLIYYMFPNFRICLNAKKITNSF